MRTSILKLKSEYFLKKGFIPIATGVYAAIVGVTVVLVALIGLLVIDADPKIISIIISGISVISPLIFGAFLFLRGKKDVDKID